MAIERTDQANGVATITLGGHEAANVLHTEDIVEFAKVLAGCRTDQAVRAVIVTGRADQFCGGRVGKKGLTRASEIAADLNAILAVNDALNALKVPVVTAIEGKAYGFAFGFTAQSDYAVAGETAGFALPEMSHGLPPLIVFSYLFRFVAYKKAFELALSSREIPAAEALQIGILTEVVPAGQALTRARAVADRMASMDAASLALFRTFARRMADVHSPPVSENAVALMSVLLSERAASH